MTTVSVIIPVKDGARHLAEVLEAVATQELDASVETLVIDSGSTDWSIEIARAAGARVIEIPPSEFGHGKTRNFAAEQARGEVLVFLTQDATPATPQWLANLIAPLEVRKRVGLSFGPHLPRRDTSPMVARELAEFFSSFSPGDELRLDDSVDSGDPATGFFSNVNSAVLRECWQHVRFRDVSYAEDQAFARDAMTLAWKKAYVPAAAVLHAHDYPFTQFMRRYFDEYRGLRETIDHVAPRHPLKITRTAARDVRRDLVYMGSTGYGAGRRLVWTARSARHHLGKGLFAALGSRAQRIPPGLRTRLSLEHRPDAPRPSGFGARISPRSRRTYPFEYILASYRRDSEPLVAPSLSTASRPMHIAWVVPPFDRGSGGHMTIFTLVDELERRGHRNSIWIHDLEGKCQEPERERADIVEHFKPIEASVHVGFEGWQGADVALATGWQTAYPVRELSSCSLKAYVVQDHEPDFFGASAERLWAEDTYRMGFPCLAASPWLGDVMRDRYGAEATHFELGVEFDVYKKLDLPREPETILCYVRASTPRRATELVVLALEEVRGRHPDSRIVMVGDVRTPWAPFEYEAAGVVTPQLLADLCNRATVGLVISLTNYSRMPKEMMACGLPVVDVDHPSVISVFGPEGDVIRLARPNPISIADRICELLENEELRDEVAENARRFVEGMTWSAAAEQIESTLRSWLTREWEPNAAASAIGSAP